MYKLYSNNTTSRERGGGIQAEIKAERADVIMCQKIKKQLPYPLNWARYVKRTVVLLWSSSIWGKSALPIYHYAFACFPSYL